MAAAACGRFGFSPIAAHDGALPDAPGPDVCGDASGLDPAAPWPVLYGCPTNAGRSHAVGPATTASKLGPMFASPGQTGVAIAAAGQVVFPQYVIGTTTAFDAATGAVAWSTPTSGSMPHVALDADGDVIVPSDHGVVYDLDLATGTPRWQIQLAGSFSAPMIDAPGTFYVGASIYGVFAVDMVAQKQAWHFTVPSGGGLDAPALGRGKLYFVDLAASQLFALDAATGAQIFDVAIAGTAQGSPVLGSDGIYVATQAAGIAAFDPETGALRWQAPATTEATVQPALLANGDLVSSTASGAAFVLAHASGEMRDQFDLGATPTSSPRVDAADVAYFATSSGEIAVKPRTGDVVWQTTVSGTAAVGDRALVVLPAQNQFVVIGP